MNEFARRLTHVPAGQTNFQIASGQTVKVFGIYAENNSGSKATVLVEDVNDNVLFRLTGNDGDTPDMTTPFLADNGIQVTTPANTTATVLHSQPGA